MLYENSREGAAILVPGRFKMHVVALTDLLMLPPVDKSESHDEKSEDSHRDQVPLPAFHDVEVHLDIAAILGACKIKFKYRREPVLWRPLQVGIRDVVRVGHVVEFRSDVLVDALAIVLVSEGEDVDECCERIDGGQHCHDEPEVVEERDEARKAATALELPMTQR